MPEEKIRTLLVHPALLPALEQWLASRGLEMRQAPGETWIVTPTDATMEEWAPSAWPDPPAS